MSVSEGEEREKGEENEEMAKNYYSYLMKNLNSQTHAQTYNGQTVQNQRQWENPPSCKKNMTDTIQGKMTTSMSDFSTEIIEADKHWNEIFNVLIVKEEIKLTFLGR